MAGLKEFEKQRKESRNVNRVDKLFNKFIDRCGVRGDDALGWLKLRYTYLPIVERKSMREKIINFTGLVNMGVQEEEVIVNETLALPDERSKKMRVAKENLLKKLETFSRYKDNEFKERYAKETPMDRELIIANNKARLLFKEKAFENWREREIKLKNATRQEREIMWIEEYGRQEIKDLKYRISRLLESGAGADDVKQYVDAIKRWEKVEEDTGKFGWGKSQEEGEKYARKESIKKGEPVAYVGDYDTKIEIEKKHWYYGKLNTAGIEDEIDEYKARTEYIERIINELPGEK